MPKRRDYDPEQYRDLPKKAHGLGDLLTFAEWLQKHGYEPLLDDDPFVTAAWRRHDGRTARIYHNEKGTLTWTPLAAEGFRAYCAHVAAFPHANDEPMKPEVIPPDGKA